MNLPVKIVIGAYGSGKSEYAINIAQAMAKNNSTALVDLDIVNPYFRSRDMDDAFSKIGIEVISPKGEFKHADVPMLSPRIMGAIQDYSLSLVLDVGGDPAGCRTLARYREALKNRGYELLMVINTKRPFTQTVEDIEKMHFMLTSVSLLNVTEFVCNTNLMEFTTSDIVEEGILVIEKAAARLNVAFKEYLVLDKYESSVPPALCGKKRTILAYHLSKPWEN